MKFSDLILNRFGEDPATVQKAARMDFPKLLNQKGLKLREPYGHIPDKNTLVVIGIAAGYSKADLALLDELCPILLAQKHELVEIFDVSTVENMDAWQIYIPHLASVNHTPVVGVCENGCWNVTKSGFEAREFIRRRYIYKYKCD